MSLFLSWIFNFGKDHHLHIHFDDFFKLWIFLRPLKLRVKHPNHEKIVGNWNYKWHSLVYSSHPISYFPLNNPQNHDLPRFNWDLKQKFVKLTLKVESQCGNFRILREINSGNFEAPNVPFLLRIFGNFWHFEVWNLQKIKSKLKNC